MYLLPRHRDLLTSFPKMLQRWTQSWKARSPGPKLAAYVSYTFVSMHPFEDGNGRLSRMLLNYALLRSGFPFTITVGGRQRKHYIQALQYADKHDGSEALGKFISLVSYGCFEAWHAYGA